MKRAIVTPFDDIDYARDGTMTPAEKINVPLRFGDDFVSLDLTEDHYKEIRELLADLLTLGHPLAIKLQRGRQPNEFYSKAREWADAAGVAYTFPGGGVDHRRLRRLYERHLQDSTKGEDTTGKG